MAFSKIVEMDEIDHILHRPDMYIGSLKTKNSEEYIFVDNKIVRKDFKNSPDLLASL